MTRIVAEFVATFTMLLAILESIVLVSGQNSADATIITAAIASGGAVTILIYGFGKISGAHMNPAVSVAMWLDDQLNTKMLFGYVFAQLLGSLCAAWLIEVTHRDVFYVTGETIPTLTEGWAWVVEMLLTFILVLVIFRFTEVEKLKKWAAIAIGLVIVLEIYFAAQYTGASMNPARSFGPAYMSGQTAYHWLFFSAPVTGAAIARYVNLVFRKKSAQREIARQEEIVG